MCLLQPTSTWSIIRLQPKGYQIRIGLCKFTELKKLRGVAKKYSIPELVELKVIYKDKIKKLQ